MVSGTIQRAFELAESGDYKNISRIKSQLNKECYEDVDDHLRGRSIRTQLQRMLNSDIFEPFEDKRAANRHSHIGSDD